VQEHMDENIFDIQQVAAIGMTAKLPKEVKS
jgi:hypothetical protein